MTTKGLVLIFVLSLFETFVGTASASRVYHCNGKVQFRPCDMELFDETSIESRPVSPVKARSKFIPKASVNSGGHPQIIDPIFRKVDSQKGQWSGRVYGKGKIGLKLLVLRNGSVESGRPMGKVILDKLKSTSFQFVSALPPGSGWSWKIVAESL